MADLTCFFIFRSFEQVVSWQVAEGDAELVLREKSSIWYALRYVSEITSKLKKVIPGKHC